MGETGEDVLHLIEIGGVEVGAGLGVEDAEDGIEKDVDVGVAVADDGVVGDEEIEGLALEFPAGAGVLNDVALGWIGGVEVNGSGGGGVEEAPDGSVEFGGEGAAVAFDGAVDGCSRPVVTIREWITGAPGARASSMLITAGSGSWS